MSTAIELHDSRLAGIARDGADLVVTLSPAYVHESTGVAGTDPGTGFWQAARLRIRRSRASTVPTHLPVAIAEGTLVAGSQPWANVVPAPLDLEVDSMLWLQLVDGSEWEARGTGVTIELFGTPTGRRAFPGCS